MNQNVRRAEAKECSVCKKKKVSNGKNWYRNSTCAACYMKRYKKTNPHNVRDAKLRCYYGIGLSEFNALLSAQGFKCAICKTPSNKLKSGKLQNFVVDHCHKTNSVRGLLCHTCNMRVGIYENWKHLLAEYLNKFQK